MTGNRGQTTSLRQAKCRGLSLVLAFLWLAGASPAGAQTDEARTLDLGDGERLAYTVRPLSADSRLPAAEAPVEPTSPLHTAALLSRHLAAGRIEDAALLSNSPRRRFEVLLEYRDAVGEKQFRGVFAEYFLPENRLLAEIAIEGHRLLVWSLQKGARIAGQYFVEIEGRWLIDDIPSEPRARLRRILEAYRAGTLN